MWQCSNIVCSFMYRAGWVSSSSSSMFTLLTAVTVRGNTVRDTISSVVSAEQPSSSCRQAETEASLAGKLDAVKVVLRLRYKEGCWNPAYTPDKSHKWGTKTQSSSWCVPSRLLSVYIGNRVRIKNFLRTFMHRQSNFLKSILFSFYILFHLWAFKTSRQLICQNHQ